MMKATMQKGPSAPYATLPPPLTVVLSVLLVAVVLSGCSAEDTSARYYQRGMALFDEGNFEKAQLEFKNALQVEGRDAGSWYMLGRIQEELGEWRKSYGSYSRAVEIDPNLIEARVRKGLLLLAGNQPEDALAEAEAVLALDAENAGGLMLRGAVARRQGDLGAAVQDVEAALAIDPEQREALALMAQIRLAQDDPAAATALLERALAAYPDDLELQLMLGGVYEKQGEVEKATAVLEQIVASDPEELSHRLRLAGYLAQHEQIDKGEAVLREAIALTPDESAPKIAVVRYLAQVRSPAAASEALSEMITQYPEEYDLGLALAELRAQQDDIEGARKAYEDVAERAGLNAAGLTARSRLATLAVSEGRLDDALALADEVLAEESQDEQALLVRGAISLDRDNTNQALADVRTILRNRPESLPAMRLLAQVHLAKNELPLAQEALSNLIAAAPDDPRAYLQLAEVQANSGNLEGARMTLDDLLAKVPDSAEAQSALARIQLSNRDWKELGKTATLLLEQRPDHPLGHYLKALSLQQQDDLEGAKAELEKALAIAPKAPEPRLALARVQMALEQPEAAEATAKALVDDLPTSIAAAELLAQIQSARGQDQAAAETYRDIIQRHPQSPTGYLGLASVQDRGGDLDAAIATLEQGADATERNAFLLYNLGNLIQKSGGDAIAVYQEVLDKAPNADVVANNLAMMLLMQPDLDEAQAARALELAKRFDDSKQPVLLDTLGWAYYKNGDYATALATLTQAAQLDDPFPELEYHLGMTYQALGRTSEARAALERALADGSPFPGSEEAQATLEEL
ncbi:tetratricopeptide repeat protein [Thiorhodovibrio winogradskyi]|uniref:tetratricopeptide repeat protein n=1 Tax=Thiorhodovibrio winogradskyi TaxID=77007 RepID=UPI0019139EF9|nr:tetratricopeptide repeat protein [Thiorhodovibrio winogradskyi]MBK5970776.1 hypothetical protein [Thiorhodovibrio winogradskyi]